MTLEEFPRDQFTVLVLDDLTYTRLLFESALQREGFRVEQADYVSVAKDVLKKRPVHLILLDLNLPDVHGLDFLKEIRKLGFSMPVIVITGNADLELVKKARNLNVFGYLLKPVKLEELRQKVNQAYFSEMKRLKEKIRGTGVTIRENLDAQFKARKTILVVDDEEETRLLFNDLLAKEGYRIHAVSSVSDALDILVSEKINLLLLDLIMPGRTGFDLLERLEIDRPELPVIIVSARSDVKSVVKARNKKIEAYFVKPVDLDRVRESICTILRKYDL
ncbi:MAG: response regulator [bacterium]|nr:response regulator [bacterium]